MKYRTKVLLKEWSLVVGVISTVFVLVYFIHDFTVYNKCNSMIVRKVSYEHCYDDVKKCFLTGTEWEKLYLAEQYIQQYCRKGDEKRT